MSLGSPPRVRGKLYLLRDSLDRIGITPARAGKTPLPAHSLLRTTDHPRACGENVGVEALDTTLRGSPPRVRGKQGRALNLEILDGITPARAGKTRRAFWNRLTERDHPRACGENPPASFCPALQRGSPPRVRGKPHSAPPSNAFKGITPARAGKTSTASAV